jgi:hypothetical protein
MPGYRDRVNARKRFIQEHEGGLSPQAIPRLLFLRESALLLFATSHDVSSARARYFVPSVRVKLRFPESQGCFQYGQC